MIFAALLLFGLGLVLYGLGLSRLNEIMLGKRLETPSQVISTALLIMAGIVSVILSVPVGSPAVIGL